MTRQANKKGRSGPTYEVGDLVRIYYSAFSKESQYSKLEAIYHRPYPVTKAFPDTDTFTIQIPIHHFGCIPVHTKLLEPWLPNDNAKFPFRALIL